MAAGVSINLLNHFDEVTVDSAGQRSVVKCRRQMTCRNYAVEEGRS